MDAKIYKNVSDKKLGGVCSGLAEYMKIDTTLIRLLSTLMSIIEPVTILVYFVLALILPPKVVTPEDREKMEAERRLNRRTSRAMIIIALAFIFSGVMVFVFNAFLMVPISISDFINCSLLALGIYTITAGIIESKTDKQMSFFKVAFGSVTLLVSTSWILKKFGVMIFSKSYFMTSFKYTWPLILVGIGLNILVLNKKLAIYIWLSIAALMFVICIFGTIIFAYLA